MLIPANTASSVTGVGQGSADRVNKGSEHMTLGVNHLIGTRVVAAGSTLMVSGASVSTSVVKFPQTLDSSDSYVANVSPVVTSSTAAPTGTFAVYGLSTTGFTVVGPSGASFSGLAVDWAVFRI